MGANILGGLLGGVAVGRKEKEQRDLLGSLKRIAARSVPEGGTGGEGGSKSEQSGGNTKDWSPPPPAARGGVVRKTGVYRLHKGEIVIPSKAAKRLHKEFRKLRRTKRS